VHATPPLPQGAQVGGDRPGPRVPGRRFSGPRDVPMERHFGLFPFDLGLSRRVQVGVVIGRPASPPAYSPRFAFLRVRPGDSAARPRASPEGAPWPAGGGDGIALGRDAGREPLDAILGLGRA
jgi:hypothetical protein